ncbi:ABC transporter ATP-binding protein [Tellurirhabdus rosea]|uniref:ABC transporter ATP-binding protein n=1 Tax=Tellurirhabdus rosea TaxID=2674997 RepID=UPI00224E67E3|nr:ATP-binding cassette domain-containing protein [Tellurirhabdus rosea]
MNIELSGIGKRFRREWIFRGVDLRLEAGRSYTFVGPNGSGKSTLLSVISGVAPATEGQLTYRTDTGALDADDWYRHIVIAAPYLELIEELTLLELLEFHQSFKPFRDDITPAALCERMRLEHARNKELKAFSSGMKQRVKLALAFYSEASVVILDEPTSNLDRQGVAWYREHVTALKAPILLIGSNVPEEYDFCDNVVDVMQWKP